jgi:hypothetical protein
MMPDLYVRADAVLSTCGLYRYRLTRAWDDGPGCVFIMLNPSTADAWQDDPTIRRCIGFARREGCGFLTVVNLFAFRATSPANMKAAVDPVGPENDAHLRAVLAGEHGPKVAAWGVHGTHGGRAAAFGRAISGVDLLCLGTTAAGAPRHPLYVRGDAPLVPFSA